MVKQVIVIRSKFPDEDGILRKLRTGKYIAQGSHASLSWLSNRIRKAMSGQSGSIEYLLQLTPAEKEWLVGSFTKVTVSVETEEELLAIYEKAKEAGLECNLITDAGRTEFNGVPTNTCLAIGPDEAEKIDPITGRLPLY